MKIVADLTFEVTPDGGARDPHPTPTTGRVRADGTEVTVEFSRTPSLAGAGTRPLVRPLAQALDDQGLTVRLQGPSGPLLDVGHGVRAPWLAGAATGSRFIRVASVPLAVRSLRGPRLFQVALPPALVLPRTPLVRNRRQRLALLARQVLRRRRRPAPLRNDRGLAGRATAEQGVRPPGRTRGRTSAEILSRPPGAARHDGLHGPARAARAA